MRNKPWGIQSSLELVSWPFHTPFSNTLPLFIPKYGTLQGQQSSLGILQIGRANVVLDALSKRSAYQCDKG